MIDVDNYKVTISSETRRKRERLNLRERNRQRRLARIPQERLRQLRPCHKAVLSRMLLSLEFLSHSGEPYWVDIRALGAINNPSEYDEYSDVLDSNVQVTAALGKIRSALDGLYKVETRKIARKTVGARLIPYQ